MFTCSSGLLFGVINLFLFRAVPISASSAPGKPLSDMKFAVIGRLQQSKVYQYVIAPSEYYVQYILTT